MALSEKKQLEKNIKETEELIPVLAKLYKSKSSFFGKRVTKSGIEDMKKLLKKLKMQKQKLK